MTIEGKDRVVGVTRAARRKGTQVARRGKAHIYLLWDGIRCLIYISPHLYTSVV